MCPHDGAVNEVQLPVDPPLSVALGLQLAQDLVPHPGPAPAIETAAHARPLAVALRQVAPWRPRPIDPEHAVDEPAVVGGRPGRWRERQERAKTYRLRNA